MTRSLCLLIGLLLLGIPNNSVAAEPLKLGIILPMTGDWQVWGDRIREGIELFRKDNPQFAFAPYYQDEGTCDPKLAFSAYKFLRDHEGIRHFIVGCQSGTEALLDKAKADKVLLMSAGFQQLRVFDVGALLVNFAFQIDSVAKPLGEIMLRQDLRRIGLIRNPGVDDFVTGIRAVVGERIVFDEVLDSSEVNLATVVTKLKRLNLDAVFVNLGESQMATFLRKAKEQQLSPKFFSSYGIQMLAESNRDILQLAEGIYYAFPRRPLSSEGFDKRFIQLGGHPPSISSYIIYDGLVIFRDTISSCDSLSPECLFEALTKTEDFKGLSGNFSIASDGKIIREFDLRRVENGKFVVVSN